MARDQAGTGTNRPAEAGLWAMVDRTAPTRRHWRAWAETETVLAPFNSIEGLRRELHNGPAERQDELLAAIVRLAQNGPHADDAQVVLIRCLSPGLRHRAGRHRALDSDEATSVMVLALVETVAGYDLAAHPHHIANRLLAAPTGRLRRAVADHARRHVAADQCRQPEDTPAPDPSPETLELSEIGLLDLAVHAEVLAPTDAWLIYVTRLAGIPLQDAAGQLGLSYDTARMRRRRAEQHWATWCHPTTVPTEAGEPPDRRPGAAP